MGYCTVQDTRELIGGDLICRLFSWNVCFFFEYCFKPSYHSLINKLISHLVNKALWHRVHQAYRNSNFSSLAIEIHNIWMLSNLLSKCSQKLIFNWTIAKLSKLRLFLITSIFRFSLQNLKSSIFWHAGATNISSFLFVLVNTQGQMRISCLYSFKTVSVSHV